MTSVRAPHRFVVLFGASVVADDCQLRAAAAVTIAIAVAIGLA